MTLVTIQTAQAEFDRLVARAEAGEEIIILRQDRPAIRLMPLAGPARRERKPGSWKGRFTVPDDALDPLTEEELRPWEDGTIVPANLPE